MPELYIPLYKIGYTRPVGQAPSVDAYVGVVDGLPGGPPMVHYRLGESIGPTMFDRKGGARHGIYFGALGYNYSSLPTGSNTAVDFKAAGYGEVPHDAGLALSAFTLSFWFQLNSFPFGDQDPSTPDRFVLLSKGQVGLSTVGPDLDIWVDVSGGVTIQWQSPTQGTVSTNVGVVNIGVPYHFALRADNTGFDAALSGVFAAKKTSFTGALSGNDRALLVGAAPWHITPGGVWPTNGFFADVVFDEVAIYNYVISNNDVLTLAQYNATPVARPDFFTVPPSSTTVMNVVNNDTFQGVKADLAVALTQQAAHGTATVRGDNDVDFVAGASEAEDSFSYRITDGFGASAPVIASVSIQSAPAPGSGDGLGGDLIWQFVPPASWIDGVAFSERSFSNCLNFARFTDPAATAGSIRQPTAAQIAGGGSNSDCCYNRAPTDHPSLEIGTKQGNNPAGISFNLDFWPRPGPNARHLRFVVECYFSSLGDLTTYASQGMFPGSNPYQSFWGATTSGGKLLIGIDGNHSGTSCQYNWFAKPSLQDDRATWRLGWSNFANDFSHGGLGVLDNCWNKSRQCEITNSNPLSNQSFASQSGLDGRWHRMELELKLATPSSVPSNATRGNTGFGGSDGTGTPRADGFSKMWINRDIDGSPSGRKQISHWNGMVTFNRTDNLYINVGLTRLLFILWFGGTGGSTVAQNPCWSWIRKAELYHFANDDL